LQEAPEEIAQKIAFKFKGGGKLNYVESEEQLAIRAEQQADWMRKLNIMFLPSSSQIFKQTRNLSLA